VSKSYTIEIEQRLRWFPLAIISCITCIGIIVGQSMLRSGNAFLIGFTLVWFVFLIQAWRKLLRAPVRIDVLGNGHARFTDILGREQAVAMSQIEEIKVTHNMMTMSYGGQKCTSASGFTGFYKFVGDVKAANPALITSGC
jgi:hypothetical protein